MTGFTKQIVLALLITFFTAVQAAPAPADKKGCTKPIVRREWRALSKDERKEWVDAVKCLHKMPHNPALTPTGNVTLTRIPPVDTKSSYYDDFVYLHMDLNPRIHFTGLFLPWHRAYVADFEYALRNDCGYKGAQPYWDWTQDASPDYPNSDFFDPSPEYGFGGFGDPNNDYEITTGAFANDFERAYPVPHGLRRNYTAQGTDPDPFGDGTPGAPLPFWNYFTQDRVDLLVNGFVGDFNAFHAQFEGTTGAHGPIHVSTGGDLAGECPQGLAPPDCFPGPKWTSNDPLFMMHHSMVDKIWYDWQKKHPENFWSYLGGTVPAHSQPGLYRQFPTGGPPFMNFSTEVPTDGIMRESIIYDVMDTKSERLCYVYE